MKSSLIFIFLFFYSLLSFAFAYNIDSLENVLTLDISDRNRFLIHDELFWLKINQNPMDAKIHADYCIILADKLDSDRLRIISFQNYGNLHTVHHKLDSALYYFDKALAISEKIENDTCIASAYAARGNILMSFGEFEEAEKTLEKALEWGMEKKDTGRVILTLSVFGSLKAKMGQNEEAISRLLLALDYASPPFFAHKRADIHGNIGALLMNLNDKNGAIFHLHKAEQIFSNKQDTFHLASIYNNLGDCYYTIKEYEKSKSYFLKGLSINHFHYPGLAVSHFGLSKYYHSMNENNLALEHAKKALYYDEEANNIFEFTVNHGHIAEILSDLKRYDESLHHYSLAENYTKGFALSENSIRIKRKKLLTTLLKNNSHSVHSQLSDYFELQDSFDLLSQQEIIKDAEAKYQAEKKEQENILLRQQKELQIVALERKKYQLLVALLGMLVLAGSIFFLRRSRQNLKRNNQILEGKNQLLSEQREQIRILNSELKHRNPNNLLIIDTFLEMQIEEVSDRQVKNILFEFRNRLEAINAISRRLTVDDDDRMVDLSAYLSDLCGYLKRAFSIEFRELNIKLLCSNGSRMFHADKAVLLGLIVNELITNSVKHAFDYQDQPTVIIQLENAESDRLKLLVKDNGSGISSEKEEERKKEGVGVSLIGMLVKQLGGKMEKRNNQGLEYIFIL